MDQNGNRRPWEGRRLVAETKTSTEIVNTGSVKNSDAKINVAAPQGDLFGPQPPALLVHADELLGRRCRCGGETWLTLPGKAMHAMAVECVTCGRHGGWVPADIAAELRRKGGAA
jgi:hypothetical protein